MSADDREQRIRQRLAELRQDPDERIWGALRREAEEQIDAEMPAEAEALP